MRKRIKCENKTRMKEKMWIEKKSKKGRNNFMKKKKRDRSVGGMKVHPPTNPFSSGDLNLCFSYVPSLLTWHIVHFEELIFGFCVLPVRNWNIILHTTFIPSSDSLLKSNPCWNNNNLGVNKVLWLRIWVTRLLLVIRNTKFLEYINSK